MSYKLKIFNVVRHFPVKKVYKMLLFCTLITYNLSLITALNGCGYSAKTLIPEKYDTIYVGTFKNKIDITEEVSQKNPLKIYRPSLEVDLVNAITERFLYDSRLKAKANPDADLVLTGSLKGFMRQPLKYADSEDVEEYRLSIVADFKVVDSSNQKTIVEQKNLVGDTTYFTTGALAKTEETAIEAAVDDLARRIVERTVEFW